MLTLTQVQPNLNPSLLLETRYFITRLSGPSPPGVLDQNFIPEGVDEKHTFIKGFRQLTFPLPNFLKPCLMFHWKGKKVHASVISKRQFIFHKSFTSLNSTCVNFYI